MSNKYEPNSIDATLSKIETKLDTALQALIDQNRRINTLEIAENKRTGALVSIGVICSIVGGIITTAISYLKGK